MDYEINDLRKIVARLSEKYTSKESSSISYDTARQLMDAVIYCIEEGEKYNQNRAILMNSISAQEAYDYGYGKVIEKVKNSCEKYNRLMMNFNAYGNENYYDCVTAAISGFFKFYDPRFSPQNTIITMDYPTMVPVSDMRGIDAVEKYIDYIYLEQSFLAVMSEKGIISILTSYQQSYRKQFYNICAIVLKHILVSCLKEGGEIIKDSRENISIRLTEVLKKLIKEKYNSNREMFEYFNPSCDEFAFEILNNTVV